MPMRIGASGLQERQTVRRSPERVQSQASSVQSSTRHAPRPERGCLHLSEAEAWLRIRAARASRKHPMLLAMLCDGRLHLSGIALLAPLLTPDNRKALLSRATHKSKSQIKELIAELTPWPSWTTARRKWRSIGGQEIESPSQRARMLWTSVPFEAGPRAWTCPRPDPSDPRVDEGREHLFLRRSNSLFEHREQLLSLPDHPCLMGRHGVSEELPHQRPPLRPDPLERRLRVLGQRSRHIADLRPRCPGPGSGTERTSARLNRHRGHGPPVAASEPPGGGEVAPGRESTDGANGGCFVARPTTRLLCMTN